MGFKNSVSYVQRQIDRVLRLYRDFARAYIDDVVIFSKTLDEHIAHLRQVFQTFQDKRISVQPEKTFIGFPLVRLLGQHIDSFGLATAEDKIKAISDLQFPTTLADLERYLGMTSYLRNYVPFYASIAEPLQERKTQMLKHAPVKGPPRQRYTTNERLSNTSDEEKLSFTQIQQALSTLTYLIHQNVHRDLYIDVDASKKGIGVFVYYVKEKTTLKPGEWPERSKCQPILFLSRLLNKAEKNYWPTEMEIAGTVWAVRKLKHMIESLKTPTKIFTDHGAITGIIH
jgi:hypothetical protein